MSGAPAHEPIEPVGAGFMVRLALANLGLWMALFAPIQVLLAQQAEALAPLGKEAALGWVTALGAAVAMFANPLAGAASDRTRGRLGARHPWTLAGALLAALSLLLLGRQHTLWGLALCWCLAQAALNAMLAALSAEVPDRVPVAQRARCSAWAGAAQPLGVVVGALLVTEVAAGIAEGYALLAALLLVLTLVYVGTTRPLPAAPQQPPSASPSSPPAAASSAWSSVDFRWAWITRALLNLGNALATLYLLYFLRDVVGYEQREAGARAEQGLLVLILLYTAGVLGGAAASGPWSDRRGRRRAPVFVSGLLMAAASALLAAAPGWPQAQVAAALTGIGWGIYLAVDQALVTQVLPQAEHRARDLGVINVASAAPQVLGPALAAVLVGLGGYPGLYAAAGVATALGGVLVWRIRGVP